MEDLQRLTIRSDYLRKSDGRSAHELFTGW